MLVKDKEVVWVIIMFIGLGVTADDFLCPALVVISKTLGLSQNVAGVTFLALGNGAPDIFSSLAGIQQQRPQLVIGALFGAGIFVTTVVAGSICLSQEFSTKRFSFLKDMVFYLGATYWTFYLFSKKEITLTDAIGFLVLYVIYITIVIVGQIIYQKLKKRQRANAIINQEEVSSVASIQDELDNRQPGVSFSCTSPVDENQHSHSLVGSHLEHFISQVINTPQTSKEYENTKGSVATREVADCVPRELLTNSMEISPWKDFLLHLSPFEIQEWNSKSWFFRIFEVVKAPVYLILTVTTPVVDYKNNRDNWCRYLNVLQSFTSPMVIFTATGKFSVVFGNVFPLWVLMSLISLLLAILVFITSSNHTPPVYHWIFGYVGFGVSVTWIYTLANEIVSLLQAAGILMNLSDAVLGLTVLAWGNSLGDLVSNMSVARMGFPQMGFSACVGGPLLNLLLGFGLSYTLTLAEAGHSVKVQFTRQIELLYGTLTTSLVSTFIILPLFKFRVKHVYGVYLLLIYLVFIILAILMELHIV
ncbi:mitochondrial sodium/calcium exchanger protein-like isoform X2 [Tachypleus tridentatus]|uniref:mitochondrial sodium/calcium exchanger protein-like isoform X2 n=1 Tax=Tachypleus tridentatus TaxID=6853 RepID=UPI003FD60051